MQLRDIRSSFLDFFSKEKHDILKSYPIVPENDPTLLFINSGMAPLKDYFTGKKQPINPRISTAQKCIRAGGKHNDLSNVGYTPRHHTFFEMLGNFSFGDYFKEEAIYYAWQYITKILSISKNQIYITVHENDQVSYNLWLQIASIDKDHIIKVTGKENFWTMGDTGPCGFCSELFIDHGAHLPGAFPGQGKEEGPRFVEIWNLVFTEYDQQQNGDLIPLKSQCIDTGAGLERLAAVMQNQKDNYNIDLFHNIITASKDIIGIGHESGKSIALGAHGNLTENDVSHRVIADHLRASSFLIAEGVLPSNDGAGYVLKRIMRRAMRHCHFLGAKEPTFHKLVPYLISEMGEDYDELKRMEQLIISEIKEEEEKFSSMLHSGVEMLNQEIQKLKGKKVLHGETIFKLYDTYGFPIDMTEDIVRSKGIILDMESFNAAMAEQKNRSQRAWKGGENITNSANITIDLQALSKKYGSTEFIGYREVSSDAEVLAIIKQDQEVSNCDSGEVQIILNKTPFYAEGGGQIGDTGYINMHRVIDTQKHEGLFYHKVILNGAISKNDIVECKIDIERRRRIESHHSATHILHHVLRQKFGEALVQKGSHVSDERLRLDFAHRHALSDKEIDEINQEVNRSILSLKSTITNITNTDEAIKAGAMSLFGEKYGDMVRVVTLDQSIELCGGTHVSNTAQIGLFKIVSDKSIASGIRRIEAKCAFALLDHYNSVDQERAKETMDYKDRIKSISQELSMKSADLLFYRAMNTMTRSSIADFSVGLVYNTGLMDNAMSLVKRIHSKEKEIDLIVLLSDCDGKLSLAMHSFNKLDNHEFLLKLFKAMKVIVDFKGGGKNCYIQAGASITNNSQLIRSLYNCITDTLLQF